MLMVKVNLIGPTGLVQCSRPTYQDVMPNYEEARIGTGVHQPGFQPQTGNNPDLDSGCPSRIL